MKFKDLYNTFVGLASWKIRYDGKEIVIQSSVDDQFDEFAVKEVMIWYPIDNVNIRVIINI